MEHLIEQARADFARDEEDADVTRGTLISRFSFAIDVREWGFATRAARWSARRGITRRPRDRRSDVWDERNDDRDTPREGS